MCIEAAPEREDVQLVEFGRFLQEFLAVGAQAGVQHGLAPAQLEVENALKQTHTETYQSELSPQLNIQVLKRQNKNKNDNIKDSFSRSSN